MLMSSRRVADVWPIRLGDPHLDFGMVETMNPDWRVLVLSNSGL
jgi:hypothetical protein